MNKFKQRCLTALAVSNLFGCASFNDTPLPVSDSQIVPTVTSTYVVMEPGSLPSVVLLKTTDGFIQLDGGDVFTCKEMDQYTLCQVFGEQL